MIEDRLERWLRIPSAPEAPAGSPESVRRFRAAPSFYRYRLVHWGIKQAGAAWGLIVGLMIAGQVPAGTVANLVRVAELLGVAGYLLQLPFTFCLVRLDYRYRWYVVTDRSLRIREGVMRVREQTMSFANVQNLTVRQGPLQRLFGIADLQVRSAGGGGRSSGEEGSQGHDLHLGFFRGLGTSSGDGPLPGERGPGLAIDPRDRSSVAADAQSIRDLILDRLRRLRDAGLGDPDEPERALASRLSLESTVGAARELLAEAVALRRQLTAGP